MSHMVRNAYGDSNITYRSDIVTNKFRQLIMVLCHGNGSAPQIWSIISSVLFSALRAQGFGINFANYFRM